MAKNRLQERDNNLPNVEYEKLLKETLATLKTHTTMFQIDSTRLRIRADEVALAVTQKLRDTKLADVSPFVFTRGVTHVTANFLNGEALDQFRALIERIQDQLASHIKTALAATHPANTIAQYTDTLLSGPEAFTNDTVSALKYPFGKTVSLSKRRLHLQARQKPGLSDTRLLGHKLVIAVNGMNEFENQLVDALCNQLEMLESPPTTTQIERTRVVLQQRLQDGDSELGMLKRIVRKEAFGRLQKEAKIQYLEYLALALRKKKTASDRGLQLLQNLQHRLRLLEEFLRASMPDEFYRVSYSGYTANYRTLFARAEVFDLLPIFSDIEGSLGETFDKEKGQQEFTIGIKLKLNGHFRSYDSTFEYYLTLLNPRSPEHKKRLNPDNPHRQAFAEKVLKLALLYYFVFKKMDDADYNPAQDVEAELLTALRGNDSDAATEREKKRTFLWLIAGLGAQHRNNLDTLKTSLKDLLKSAGSDFDLWPTPLYLSIDADLLDLDEDRMINEKKFFRVEALQERGMNLLKYVTIEDASAAGNSLCSLPVKMTFEPIYYYSTQEETAENFSLAYNIKAFEFLPVIYPPNTDENLKLCEEYYRTYPHIQIPYAPTLPYADAAPLFIYHFTYILLTYMCLKLLYDQVQPALNPQKRLFFPLVRIHQAPKPTEKDEKRGEEEFLRALSKTLAHLLSEQGVLANAQGLHINALKPSNDQLYKLPNALSSLYSVLPKVFTLPTVSQLDHLAVIVVSSRKSDAHRDSEFHLSNIYGEVIGIRRYQDGKRVQVVPLGSFSTNEASDNLYRTPTVLRDQAKNCYEKGYKHILYVAQAPYSSFLHLTSAETPEEQFFMSGSIIQSLKQGQNDLHIYPVYCDKFYVTSIGGKVDESLYVDDTSELRSILNDRSSIPFFNLLNGKVVNTERSFYNGVVSYATLINVYDDPIYDQDIRNHLLDGSQPGSLKQDILTFLMLLHFSRYERYEHEKREQRNQSNRSRQQIISFKLDPYENIIGFDSVGTLGIIDHMATGTHFNMLAFLTEVRSVLNRQYSGYSSLLLGEEDQESEETDTSQ